MAQQVTRRLLALAAVLAVGCHFDRSGVSSGVSGNGPGDATQAEGPGPVDGGCPPGQLLCGGQCVDPSTSVEHCGGCDKPCEQLPADRCQAGNCVCGSGPACTHGLSCVSGACACAAGPDSACDGCCENNVCHPLGSGQNPTRCGKDGEACKSCDDGQVCTADSCLTGVCQNAPVPDGTLCDDGQFCSEADSCKQGQCLGRPRDCKDNDPCTVNTCDETQDKCVFPPAPNGTICGMMKFCWNGKCQEFDP
jgi:hypothetical protein